MAFATGLVQSIKYNPSINAVFFWLGPSSLNTIVYYVLMSDSDSESQIAVKGSMVDGLTTAMLNGRMVSLLTDDANPFQAVLVAISPV